MNCATREEFMRRLTGLIASVAMTLAMGHAFAQDPGVTDTEIVIGGIAPFTGPAGTLGYAGILGTRVAAEEINAAGGINGRMIKLANEDDEYVPAKTVQAMQKLMDVDQVFAMTMVSGGSHGLAIMPTIEENDIPVINPLVTTDAHYEPPRNSFFGIGMGYQDAVPELMKVMEAKNPGLKWGSLVQDDESGIAREEGMDIGLKAMGQEAVLKQRFKRGQAEFAAEILRAKESGATAMILGALPAQHAAMFKEMKKIGFAPKIGVMWIDHIPQAIPLYGPEGDGVYMYDFVPSMTDPKVAPFLETAKKYLSEDDMKKLNRYSLIGYASVKLHAAAMAACGKELTRACEIENLKNTKDFETGFMAPFSFGDGRLTKLTGGVIQVDAAGGKFVPVQ
jgi:branched-chain amino acid transport system substrate-binding protein